MGQLLEKQQTLAMMLAKLLVEMKSKGFDPVISDAYRNPMVFGPIGTRIGYGHPKSAHKRKLAIDIDLFKDGQYLISTEHHRQFGEFWKSLDPDARWGGDFKEPDGNHYSITYEGIS